MTDQDTRSKIQCEDLTSVERDVLRLMYESKTRVQIGNTLELTKDQLTNLIGRKSESRLFKKIQVENRPEAIIWYRDNCLEGQKVTVIPDDPFWTLFRTLLTAVYVCILGLLFFPLGYSSNDVSSFMYIWSDMYAIIPAIAGGYGLYRFYFMPVSDNISRKTTLWLSIGLLFWAVGQTIWVILYFLYGDTVPYPSPADAGYTVHAVALLIGIYFLYKGLLDNAYKQLWFGALVALILIAISVAATLWARNGQTNMEDDPLKLILDIVYPALDAIGVGLLAQIIRQVVFFKIERQMQWVVSILTAGIFVLYIADATFSVTVSLPESNTWVYYNGSLADILFATAFWILGLGISFIPQFYRSKASELKI